MNDFFQVIKTTANRAISVITYVGKVLINPVEQISEFLQWYQRLAKILLLKDQYDHEFFSQGRENKELFNKIKTLTSWNSSTESVLGVEEELALEICRIRNPGSSTQSIKAKLAKNTSKQAEPETTFLVKLMHYVVDNPGKVLLGILILQAACAEARPLRHNYQERGKEKPVRGMRGVASRTKKQLAKHAPRESSIVELLNQAWNNTARQGCGQSDPDYFCSGVLIHVADGSEATNQPWMPSRLAIDRGRISFSYLRRDIVPKSPLWHPGYFGYIFRPQSILTTHQKPYTMYCVYPKNAFTIVRPDKGCGHLVAQERNASSDLSTCKNLNVTTPEKYIKFLDSKGYECSLAPDKTGFTLMIETMKLWQSRGKLNINNEIVIKEWASDKSIQVPLEAFFYFDDGAHVGQEKDAFAMADLYYKYTGIKVPVVHLNYTKLVNDCAEPFEEAAPIEKQRVLNPSP